MKKILVGFVAVAVIFTSLGCGQKKNIFQHSLFSVEIPDGWKATQDKNDAYSVMIDKSSTDYLSIECTDQNTDTYETMFAKFKTAKGFENAKFEDVTIGNNTFKKLSLGKMKKSVALYYLRENTGIMLEVANLEGAEEQAILKSMIIKQP